MGFSLEFRAGRKALEIINDEGLNPERIRVLAGASGGPKWLVLAGIDKVLPSLFENRERPLHMIGSSIGVWRSAALAQRDPLKAVTLFQDNYIAQSYDKKPSPEVVTAESQKILDAFIGDEDPEFILNHPFMHLNIIAVKSLFPGNSDKKFALLPALGAAAVMNLFHRPFINLLFKRTLFYDKRDSGVFKDPPGFDTEKIVLNKKNFKRAILATGSIPLVMSGVENIDGAAKGVYRDGGLIDYHLDIPFPAGPDDIVLYPHFYNRIVPGWFDKGLSRRKPSQENMDNVLLVSPSEEFVSSLPMKKIPDRNDFYHFRGKDEERKACWRNVAEKSDIPGRELLDAVNTPFLKDRIRPIATR